MKINQHFHIRDELQRSEVSQSNHSFRRIVHWVNPDGTLGDRLENPRWERFYCGKYQPVTADESVQLERDFINALIQANQP